MEQLLEAYMLKIMDNFEDYTLVDENEGRKAFWKEIMHTLAERTFPLLKIGVPMPKGVGGFFTDHYHLDSINLPDTWEVKGKEVTYKDDEAFMIFVHESCHFLHLSRDEGMFISPVEENGTTCSMKDLLEKESLRRDIEYEAGYRAMLMDRAFKMFPGSRVNLDGNLRNMINYDIKYQTPEWRKKFMKKMGKLKDDEYKAAIDKYISKVKKFSDWADKHHKI